MKPRNQTDVQFDPVAATIASYEGSLRRQLAGHDRAQVEVAARAAAELPSVAGRHAGKVED